MSQRKRYTPEVKAKAVLEILKETKSLAELSSAYGAHSTQLVRWKNHVIQELPKIFLDPRISSDSSKDELIQELYGRIGLLSTQVEWLKKKSGLNPEQS